MVSAKSPKPKNFRSLQVLNNGDGLVQRFRSFSNPLNAAGVLCMITVTEVEPKPVTNRVHGP